MHLCLGTVWTTAAAVSGCNRIGNNQMTVWYPTTLHTTVWERTLSHRVVISNSVPVKRNFVRGTVRDNQDEVRMDKEDQEILVYHHSPGTVVAEDTAGFHSLDKVGRHFRDMVGYRSRGKVGCLLVETVGGRFRSNHLQVGLVDQKLIFLHHCSTANI